MHRPTCQNAESINQWGRQDLARGGAHNDIEIT